VVDLGLILIWIGFPNEFEGLGHDFDLGWISKGSGGLGLDFVRGSMDSGLILTWVGFLKGFDGLGHDFDLGWMSKGIRWTRA
jgi:hypothetical protein